MRDRSTNGLSLQGHERAASSAANSPDPEAREGSHREGVGYPLEWEELPAGHDSRISACLVGASPRNTDDWNRQHEWLASKLE